MIDYLDQLRKNVINLKSLDQEINDPIIAGAGETGGPQLYVILTQEAAARFTPTTKLYLSWKHRDLNNVIGYNMFTQVSEKPNTWAIAWPPQMKYEGTVEACLEIVDAISIDQSRHFNIEVLSDLQQDNKFAEEEYDVFHQSLLKMAQTNEETRSLLEEVTDLQQKAATLYEQMLESQQETQERVDTVEEEMRQLQEEWKQWQDFFTETLEKMECCIAQCQKDKCPCSSKDKEFGLLTFKSGEIV